MKLLSDEEMELASIKYWEVESGSYYKDYMRDIFYEGAKWARDEIKNKNLCIGSKESISRYNGL